MNHKYYMNIQLYFYKRFRIKTDSSSKTVRKKIVSETVYKKSFEGG